MKEKHTKQEAKAQKQPIYEESKDHSYYDYYGDE